MSASRFDPKPNQNKNTKNQTQKQTKNLVPRHLGGSGGGASHSCLYTGLGWPCPGTVELQDIATHHLYSWDPATDRMDGVTIHFFTLPGVLLRLCLWVTTLCEARAPTCAPLGSFRSTGHGYRDTAPGTETVSNRHEDAAQSSHADSQARRHREQPAEGAQTSRIKAKQAPQRGAGVGVQGAGLLAEDPPSLQPELRNLSLHWGVLS